VEMRRKGNLNHMIQLSRAVYLGFRILSHCPLLSHRNLSLELTKSYVSFGESSLSSFSDETHCHVGVDAP
jgi:hypothetical protein